jgi:hypothetical protein
MKHERQVEAERKRQDQQDARWVEDARLQAREKRCTEKDPSVPERNLSPAKRIGQEVAKREHEDQKISFDGHTSRAEETTDRDHRR